MKLKITLLAIFCMMSSSLLAQRGGNVPSSEKMERLKAMKVGVITEKVSLSPDQAKEFWPVYNNYEAEKSRLRANMRNKLRQIGREDVEKAELARQDEIFKMKEQELELEKKYRPKLLEIISATQYSNLLLAEMYLLEGDIDKAQQKS